MLCGIYIHDLLFDHNQHSKARHDSKTQIEGQQREKYSHLTFNPHGNGHHRNNYVINKYYYV